jgi:hypothetical protein
MIICRISLIIDMINPFHKYQTLMESIMKIAANFQASEMCCNALTVNIATKIMLIISSADAKDRHSDAQTSLSYMADFANIKFYFNVIP